ncbi:pentapeptide repeat-containing protein [Cronbergia sp. UHCC 0137]|uniref:pentapeptide repeat-containing protein n=1 Tax=Cronbergia sp. UHCC 0137 TaxID=3110239 RepID=UPI002B201213|nr:pentapeptide repeat-containing protein [Cronbergia sp. UHCC 0137]MEA5616383.1 pentapeptide repeat-containing protein [Cronbergia sp. UHCC 0137]
MTSPMVRRSGNQSSQSKEPKKGNLLPLGTRRFGAWAVEITLVAVSGLVPFGLGVYANSRSDIERIPLNPVLVLTERAIARPLALPVSYSIRYVSWPTNFLWTIALLTPITISSWQLYLLSKTGSTIPKRWFGVRVVNHEGTPPGLGSIVVREVLGRWTVPISVAYLLWRYSFVFPHLSVFTFLALLMVLGEGMGWPAQRKRRAFHDCLAGTYTIDAKEQLQRGTEPGISTSSKIPTPGNVIQRNPNFTLFLVGLTSMIAVLSTLVSTQIYVQTQESNRRTEQINSQKFLALITKINSTSDSSNKERENAILALGGLNDRQSIKFLVDLLVQETDPTTVDKVQQALINAGLPTIPELKRMNQFLADQLKSVGNSPMRESKQRQLILNQQAINKVLAVYRGKIKDVDLSNTQLGTKGFAQDLFFKLVLEKSDLSGVIFKGANLNQANFQGSRFRGVGEDGRWDTYDDAIADLNQVELKQANFTDANLSRVSMNKSDLSRATLNRANLSNARLMGANLSSTQLVGSDLRGTILENASLTGADISDSQLTGANLYAANLNRASAIGTQLSHANLTKTNWQGADLSESYLDHANLSNANLSVARLTGAVFRSAKLENANLRNADLSRADLRGANVAGADFQGAILSTAKQDPGDQFVQTPDLDSQAAIIQGVDFSEAKNLDRNQLAFICTQGGIHSRCP